MAENQPNVASRFDYSQESIRRLAEKEYIGGGQSGLEARWSFYNRYDVNPISYYSVAYSMLECDPSDTLLDIGCSDGWGLWVTRESLGHTGPLIGLDFALKADSDTLNFGKYLSGRSVSDKDNPINFIHGLAEELPFESGSIDVVMAMFMLYHSPSPTQAIEEMIRVAKPNSRIAIATSGADNKREHRRFEGEIAQYLQIEPPASFTSSFDAEVAEEILPDYFSKIRSHTHKSVAIIPSHEWQALIGSLDSMREHYDPIPDTVSWDDAINQVVMPKLEQAFKERGYFMDTIDRRIYVCEGAKQQQ